MATDPADIGEFQKALNDTASKVSVLTTTFVSVEIYLLVILSSVTHRDLFLETPLKLPLLSVDVPLVSFFVVAPIILLIFHFYIFLQLVALTDKASDFNKLLSTQCWFLPIDDQRLRHRLDSFWVLQFIAGPENQRKGTTGLWLRIFAWLMLVVLPVLILLLAQSIFLPYHHSWVTWLHRIIVLLNLAVTWICWGPFRAGDYALVRWMTERRWVKLGLIVSILILYFTFFNATHPGESHHREWEPLHQWAFEGQVNEIASRPSVLSDRLILTDQSFIDVDRLDKFDVSRSVRGRDLRNAVFNRADLRQVDFTGAMLNGASFDGATLYGARFGCAPVDKERSLDWPDGCTWLEGAKFRGARLFWLTDSKHKSASFEGAHLCGAIW